MTFEFGDDFLRAIEVLALDEPAVRLVIAFFEDALGGDAARQRVGKAAFARDDYGKYSPHRVAEPPHFPDSRRQVRQMLEHVNGQNAVERAVREFEALLAIALVGLNAGKAPAEGFDHVGAQFQRDIVSFLLRGKPLVIEVLAQTRANFKSF